MSANDTDKIISEQCAPPKVRITQKLFNKLRRRLVKAIKRIDPKLKRTFTERPAVWVKADLICKRWEMVMDRRNAF